MFFKNFVHDSCYVAISLHAQVQFHTKYPFFDSQSDSEFSFSYAILFARPQRKYYRDPLV